MRHSTHACGPAPAGSIDDIGDDDAAISAYVVYPCSETWKASSVYTAGNGASLDGVNYRANWWTQGDDPKTHNGGAGSGMPWLSTGPCAGGTADASPAPAAPPAAPAPSTPAAPAPTGVAAPVAKAQFMYSAYKDVSISANWNTNVISTNVTQSFVPLVQLAAQTPAITWAFATGECGSESWGGLSGSAVASANVAAWAKEQKPYIISTGGAAGVFSCASDAGFASFLDRYMSASMFGVDFDIEAGQTQAQIDALVQRVAAAQKQDRYKNLRFSFTIATLGGNAPQSLGTAGVMVMQSIKQAGLTNYYINLMAMDYGSATPTNCMQATDGSCSMGLSANQAAINLHQYYSVPYSQIELTPMIGGNDTQGETFGLADVDTLTAFVRRMGLGGVHFWSLDRDCDCAPGWASPTCNSYGKAGNLGFIARLRRAWRREPMPTTQFRLRVAFSLNCSKNFRKPAQNTCVKQRVWPLTPRWAMPVVCVQ